MRNIKVCSRSSSNVRFEVELLNSISILSGLDIAGEGQDKVSDLLTKIIRTDHKDLRFSRTEVEEILRHQVCNRS